MNHDAAMAVVDGTDILWAAHAVHHQSEDYNLSTALRQSWTAPVIGWVFWLPLPLLGFHPLMVLTAQAVSLLYQYWIHTELVGSMGAFGLVFNTPSHHRVHHATNPQYLDRNHGGILIVWDRLFGTFEGFKKAMDTFDSPNHGLDFCMGCWSEMGGHDNVMRGFDAFVPDGKIAYIHFRAVRGTRECFHECFIDEGQVDTYAVVQRLKQLGFDGFMIPDHVPATVGDSGWHHRGRAHCVGFMQAMIQAVDRQEAA